MQDFESQRQLEELDGIHTEGFDSTVHKRRVNRFEKIQRTADHVIIVELVLSFQQ